MNKVTMVLVCLVIFLSITLVGQITSLAPTATVTAFSSQVSGPSFLGTFVTTANSGGAGVNYYQNGLQLGPTAPVTWGSTNQSGTYDSGFIRLTAGVVRVTNGGAGFGRIALDNSTPANAAAACTAQSIWADASFVYVCTATGVIKRAAIATW